MHDTAQRRLLPDTAEQPGHGRRVRDVAGRDLDLDAERGQFGGDLGGAWIVRSLTRRQK